MENKLFYPAIFHQAEEGGFWITFPDIPEAITEGDDMQSAYEMAVDCLGLTLSVKEDEKKPFPVPSSPDLIKVQKDEFLVVIEVDMAAYKKRLNPKSVKKTLTIPQWLDEEASSHGINFSRVLQEALINKLHSM